MPIFTLTGRDNGEKADPKQGRATIATMEAIFMVLSCFESEKRFLLHVVGGKNASEKKYVIDL